jgi:hypothetical protein
VFKLNGSTHPSAACINLGRHAPLKWYCLAQLALHALLTAAAQPGVFPLLDPAHQLLHLLR